MFTIAATVFVGAEAFADTSTYNSGFNLPGVQLPQGHDEVRAADGTTCRSAVAGSGAYIDMGFIGNPEQTDMDGSFSAYGRMVIPLGRKAPRLDCSRLYDLEVARLEMELKLMQMGLTRGIAPVSDGMSSHDDSETGEGNKTGSPIKLAEAKTGGSWAEEGWTMDGKEEK